MQSEFKMDGDRFRRFLRVIFIAALILRLGYALSLGSEGIFPDSLQYRKIAVNIRAGNGFVEDESRQTTRPPVYPLFLALMPGGAEGSVLPARLAQALIAALTALLAGYLGRRMFGPRAGLFAAGIAAVYPYHIYFSGAILSETPFMLSLVGVVWFLARAAEVEAEGEAGRMSPRVAALAAGAVAGLAVLTRASFLMFPAALLPAWLIVARKRRAVWGRWLLLVCGMCAVMLPWVVRNWNIYHRIVPTTLQVGESLYEANNPNADGGPMMDRIDWNGLVGEENLGEYGRDRYFRDLALSYMRTHPARTLELAIVKLGRFWNIVPNFAAYRGWFFVLVSVLSYAPVLLMSLYGCARLRGQWRRLTLLLLPVAYYSLLHMVFVGSIRYRIPVDLFLIIVAGAAAAMLWRGGRESTA